MKVTLASERPTLIDVWRDSDPSPGEKPIERVLVESTGSYYAGRSATVVGAYPHVATPRLQQFLVEKSPEADRLIAALKEGPVKPRYTRPGEVTIDLDRIKRETRSREPVVHGSTHRSGMRGEIFHSGVVGRVLSVEGRPVER